MNTRYDLELNVGWGQIIACHFAEGIDRTEATDDLARAVGDAFMSLMDAINPGGLGISSTIRVYSDEVLPPEL